MSGNSPIRAWQRIVGGFAALALVALLGCGAKGQLNGKVSYKQGPLPKGTRIVFLHVKSDRSFTADIKGDDGMYSTETLPTGEFKIGVQPANAPNVPAVQGGAESGSTSPFGKKDKMGRGGPADTKDVAQPPPGMFDVFNQNSRTSFFIPQKYREPKESGLTVNVTGGKQTFDITVPDN